MSNPIETRYLVVTLHDAAGEEADAVAEYLEEQLTDGFTVAGTVDHALGQVLPPGVRLAIVDGLHGSRVFMFDGAGAVTHSLEVDDARALAGALLIAAGDAETANQTRTTDQNGI